MEVNLVFASILFVHCLVNSTHEVEENEGSSITTCFSNKKKKYFCSDIMISYNILSKLYIICNFETRPETSNTTITTFNTMGFAIL